MDLTSITWLALILVFIVAFLVGRFLFPKCPQEIPMGGSGDVPTSGGTLRFRDHYHKIFVIEVPRQKFPVRLTFTNKPRTPEDSEREKHNPTQERVYRSLIKLNVTDENGKPVDHPHFDPAIKVTATYLPDDLAKVKEHLEKDMGDHDRQDAPQVRAVKADPKLKEDRNFLANYLILFYHDGTAWRRLPMLPGSRNTRAMTLTAYAESFSSTGVGGEP